jgi:hypothetical protein
MPAGGMMRRVWNSAASLKTGLPLSSFISVKRGMTPPP